MAEVRHNQGEAGGYLVGRRHSKGGIKAVNKSTGQPLEMEGGEVVITRDAVSDPKKRSFNGKMMTNRQILSEINQSGGGVAFAEGGEVPETMNFSSDAEYEYGGKTMCGCDLATEMSRYKTFEEGGNTSDDALAEEFQFEFNYNGWTQRYSRSSPYEINIQERGLYTILAKILRHAVNLEDTAFQFVLKLRIIISNGVDQQIPILVQVPYEDLIASGGFDYNTILEDCLEKIRNSQLPNAEKVATTFYEAQKMYFLAIDGTIYGTSDESIDQDFRQKDFKDFDAKTRENAYSHLISVMSDKMAREFADVDEKTNFKDWEKGVRALNKKTKEQTGKLPTAMSIAPTIKLANLSDGYFSARMELFIAQDKPFITKWDWWKKNVFSKVTFFVQEYNSDTERVLRLTFENVDFTPYEQEIGNVLPASRSSSRRDKASMLAKEILVGKDGFSFFQRTNYQMWAYDNIKIDDVQDYARFDFYLRVLIPELTNATGYNSVTPEAKQAKIFFVGSDGVFAWNTPANRSFRGSNFVITVNEEGKKLAAQRKAAAEAARAAQRKAAKEAAKAEKQRQEELKNRKFRVRDQPEDFDFLMPEDADNDINRALKAEKQALVTMLKMAQSPKNFNMRKIILKKISKIEKTLEDNRLNEGGNEQIDVKKLMTPKGLMDYYFNQARQNPVKKMNEACGLETPTGVPSKLSLQAYKAVRTKYFKRWFGDWESAAASGDYTNCSKIVDPETKEPRIMYHGVRRYDPRVKVSNMGQGVTRPYGDFKAPNFPATYFGSDLSYVEFYAGMAENQPHPDPNYEGFIYYVFLNMRNPIMLDGLGVSKYSYQDLLAYLAINYGMVVQPSQDLLQKIQGNRKLKAWNYIRNDLNLIAAVKKAGFDGIIQVGDVPTFTPEGKEQDIYMNGDEYLVFNANQVKSAIVKNSFYMSAIDDVRFKDGGYVRI
jgi:hypothetical protein